MRLHRSFTLETFRHEAEGLWAAIAILVNDKGRRLGCLGLIKLLKRWNSDKGATMVSVFITAVHKVHVSMQFVDMREESFSVLVSHLTVWVLVIKHSRRLLKLSNMQLIIVLGNQHRFKSFRLLAVLLKL